MSTGGEKRGHLILVSKNIKFDERNQSKICCCFVSALILFHLPCLCCFRGFITCPGLRRVQRVIATGGA